MKKTIENISTVIVTDIVGYSKLTGNNQDLALELLAEHDKIIIESMKLFNGNILVNRGDGFVAMFSYPADAVLCSMDIQNKITTRNKFNIKSRLFRIRIGIHTGSYSKDGNDYHGECIDGASILEPLAPYGGILISSYLNSLLELEDNVYTREYDKVILNDKEQTSYKVYLDLLDWYKNKENKKIHNIIEKQYLDLSHNLYGNGNYSGSIKFANSVFEKTKNKKSKFNTLSFLCNSFIALGQLEESKKLLKLIKSQLSKPPLELKAHLLKLEGHLHFNNEKWNKANSLFKESFDILDSIKSRYKNEILFYYYLNSIFSNSNSNKKIIIKSEIIIDDYRILIDCILLILNNKELNNDLLDKVNAIEKDQLKAYGFWIISKYYGINNMVDKSYEYETKSQETLKIASQELSDIILREQFLKNLIIHSKILSETSVQIDDLIDVSDVSEDDVKSELSIIYNNELVFNYCISCGQKNINKNIKCSSCATILSQSYYD